jgi:hypothetical protein
MQSGALGCFGNGKIKTIRRRKLPLSIFYKQKPFKPTFERLLTFIVVVLYRFINTRSVTTVSLMVR